MKRSTWIFLLIIAILALTLAACSSGAAPATEASGTSGGGEQTAEPSGGTTGGVEATSEPSADKTVAVLLFTQEFDSLSPLYTNMYFSIITYQFWLNWAWQFDDQNEAYPVMVTEIPSTENGGISEDGTVITMHLRDDLKWSDGEPLTADDFIFTYNMIMDPGNAVNSTYPYDAIASMEAPDPQTIVITFSEPFAPWLATLWHGLLPQHVLQPVFDAEGTIDNADWNLAPTVGAGPYVFSEWESGSFARFVRNDNYWGPAPAIDEIFVRFVPDDAAQIAALKAGEGDVGVFISYSDVPDLEDSGVNIVTVFSGYNEGWYFYMDPEKGHPALQDVNVRRAIAMAFDRESLNNDLLLGLTRPAVTLWDNTPYQDPSLAAYPYDPAKANELLDAAGWVDSNGDGTRDKDGRELELTYGTTTREIRQDTQAVAQQQLAEVGIKLDISNYDADIFFSGFADGGPAATGQLDISEWSDAPYFPDPDIAYWLCSEQPSDENPSGTNWQQICDETLDGLFQQEATQVDFTQRQQTFYQITKIMFDQVYWLGLWNDPDVWATSARLQGAKLSGVTPFYNVTDWTLGQ